MQWCVFFRYISWTEQNFPKGGKESNLQALLEHCVSLYKDEEKYKNDARYLNVWIKFVSFSHSILFQSLQYYRAINLFTYYTWCIKNDCQINTFFYNILHWKKSKDYKMKRWK